MNFPNFSNYFKPAPELLIAYNVGAGFDIPTGSIITGIHGESIINGGLSHITGIGAKGNAYKTTTTMHMVLTASGRYTSQAIIDDTENIFDLTRMYQISKSIDEWKNTDIRRYPNIILMDGNTQVGEWFTKIKKFGEEKRKNANKCTGTTPFPLLNGEAYKVLYPTFVALDCLSTIDVKEVATAYDKFDVGDSKTNTVAMTTARIKSQMLVQLPAFTSECQMYMSFTAQLGTKMQMDPMKPNTKDLSFMKQNEKFKDVPEKFNFLMNNLYQFNPAIPMFMSSSDKTIRYPKGKDDRGVGNTDLQVINGVNVRSKKGIAGVPFAVVASQTEGIKPTLTELEILRSNGNWSMGGNDRTWFIHLTPELTLMRTTVRAAIDSSYSLRRAINICSELCQMSTCWFDERVDNLIRTDVLYDKIKDLGYNWEFILAHTRGWWAFLEQEPNLPTFFLSSKDLLNMASGTYHPYWLEEDKNTIKKEFRKIDGFNTIEEYLAADK